MPRFVVVAGPTAAGKSEIALEIAERFGGEIVNADSRQVYRFMDLGTDKPGAEDRARVPHHLFDVRDPDEPLDAAAYRDLARAAVREISARGRLPVVVGGTGLYLRALRLGLFAAPRADAPLRAAIDALDRASPGRLHAWCRRLDPETAARLHPNDRVRLVRALEFVLRTGEPLSRAQRRHAFGDAFGPSLELVLVPPPAELARRIELRSRRMLERGLVDEARALAVRGFGPHLRILRSIGYAQAWRVVAGEWTEARALEDLVAATRRLAKRQLTWFRSEPDAVRLDPVADRARVHEAVQAFLEGAPG